MGIIDIDRRARLADDRALQPPAHRLNPAQQFQHLRHVPAGRNHQARRRQRIGRLIGTDQRQIDLICLAVRLNAQRLSQLRRRARDEPQRFAFLANAQQAQAARGHPRNHLVRPGIVRPHHRRAIRRHDFIEQPHLRVEIAVHVAMIVEMVARQVGEAARQHRQPFGTILRQPVARRLERGMGNAFAAQPRHVRQESDDVRRGQARRHLIHRCRDAQRADRRGMMAHHPPQLPGQFDRAGLAVRAGDGNRHIGKGREIACGKLREKAARIGVGDMDRAFDPGFWPRDDRDRPRLHSVGNVILAIDAQPLKGAEHRAGRNLAIVDCKAGDIGVQHRPGAHSRVQPVDQPGKARHSASPLGFHSNGVRSEISTSRRSSGITPSIGPVRSITRLTTGAAVQAAVRRPIALVAPSIMVRTT